MGRLCNLVALFGIFCFGLSSVDARHHEGGGNRGDGNHGDMGRPPRGDQSQMKVSQTPPPNPKVLDIIEGLLQEGAFSDEAVILIEHLLLTLEERQEAGKPDISESERVAVAEEISGMLLEGKIPNRAKNYFRMVLDDLRRAGQRGRREAERQRQKADQEDSYWRLYFFSGGDTYRGLQILPPYVKLTRIAR